MRSSSISRTAYRRPSASRRGNSSFPGSPGWRSSGSASTSASTAVPLEGVRGGCSATLKLWRDATMQPRIKSPAMTVPGALEALIALTKSIEKCGVPRATLELMNMRASQINGCSVCLDLHSRALKKIGEKDECIIAVAAWREAPYYSDAERAALV